MQLSSLRARIPELRDEKEQTRFNVLRAMILSDSDMCMSVLSEESLSLRRLIEDSEAHSVFCACVNIGLRLNDIFRSSDLVTGSFSTGQASGSVEDSSCRLLNITCAVSFESVSKIHYNGLVNSSYMPREGFLEMYYDDGYVLLYHAKFINGIIAGRSSRVTFSPHHIPRYERVPLVLIPKLPDTISSSKLCIERFDYSYITSDGEAMYRLCHNPSTDTLICCARGRNCQVHDDILVLDGREMFYGYVESINGLLYHVCAQYLMRPHMCEFRHFIDPRLRPLENKFKVADFRFLHVFIERAPSRYKEIILAYDQIHRDGTTKFDETGIEDVLIDMAIAYKKKPKEEEPLVLFDFGILWIRNIMNRWHRRVIRQRDDRVQRQTHGRLLDEHSAQTRHKVLHSSFFRLWTHALQRRTFLQWRTAHRRAKDIKKKCFSSIRIMVTKRRLHADLAVFSFPAKRWYNAAFDPVFVRDYPRNPYTGKIENMFVGYVASCNRNHWWPLTGSK